ncbi:terminase small subunit [Mucilaginibacter sp. HMF5004]|uniref:terminase small subunit n=1 Tax=Mucilaginibacter rivuli TaxID=2857527 RepID=UPI001C5EDB54|nr:terminase small subunit [Mucilaginibacter rivuli]MBW4888194.1 terminase small subunit [Mucilaginibacter rivuli]
MDQFLNLSRKQALFCEEYFKDFNATKAALRAGYSAATALNGYLMTLPKIRCHLQQRGAEAAERAQVTQQMLLAELKTVGFARMSNFFGADGKPKPMHEVDEDTKAALLNYTVTEDKQGATTIKIRMNNKLSALDKIAKHIKFYEGQNIEQAAMYWVVSGQTLDEQDRYDDDSFAKKETEQELEIAKRITRAVAAAEKRIKAEFALKLKQVKKEAKEKLKNTQEYPRVGVENQESRIKRQDEGGQNQESRIKRQDDESRMPEGGSQQSVEQGEEQGQVVAAERKVFGDREGQYTAEGYLIKHDNPDRDKSCPYYSPYTGLYIEKRMGSMMVKSYLPVKRWSRKEETQPGVASPPTLSSPAAERG